MKKLILVLMVLAYSFGYSQYTITLDVPDMAGVTAGETIVFPVTCTAISPDPVSSFYIYLEWDDAVLDFVSAEMSPEMLGYVGVYSFFFATGSQTQGPKEAMVGSWSDLTPTGTNFLMSAGDVFFNVTATYVGDGTEVPGVGATAIDFQFSKKSSLINGKLAKGVTEILSPGVPAILFTTTPENGSINVPIGSLASTWSGANGTVWDNAGNWDVLPAAGDDVIIPAGMPNYPNVVNLDVTVGALEVELGADITLGFDG